MVKEKENHSESQLSPRFLQQQIPEQVEEESSDLESLESPEVKPQKRRLTMQNSIFIKQGCLADLALSMRRFSKHVSSKINYEKSDGSIDEKESE